VFDDIWFCFQIAQVKRHKLANTVGFGAGKFCNYKLFGYFRGKFLGKPLTLKCIFRSEQEFFNGNKRHEFGSSEDDGALAVNLCQAFRWARLAMLQTTSLIRSKNLQDTHSGRSNECLCISDLMRAHSVVC
jgi:hypothetical protein